MFRFGSLPVQSKRFAYWLTNGRSHVFVVPLPARNNFTLAPLRSFDCIRIYNASLASCETLKPLFEFLRLLHDTSVNHISATIEHTNTLGEKVPYVGLGIFEKKCFFLSKENFFTKSFFSCFIPYYTWAVLSTCLLNYICDIYVGIWWKSSKSKRYHKWVSLSKALLMPTYLIFLNTE